MSDFETFPCMSRIRQCYGGDWLEGSGLVFPGLLGVVEVEFLWQRVPFIILWLSFEHFSIHNVTVSDRSGELLKTGHVALLRPSSGRDVMYIEDSFPIHLIFHLCIRLSGLERCVRLFPIVSMKLFFMLHRSYGEKNIPLLLIYNLIYCTVLLHAVTLTSI